jgi:hypothetical protein
LALFAFCCLLFAVCFYNGGRDEAKTFPFHLLIRGFVDRRRLALCRL